MALNQSVLATELAAIEPSLDVATSAQAWADAYATYALGAAALSPIIPAAVDGGKAAMLPVFLGMAVPNAAASVIQSGIAAFWGAVALGLSASFAGAIAIIPPPLVGLVLDPVFVSITAAQKSVEDAAQDIAALIHSQTIIGGLVTTPGIPPIVTPIL